MHSSESDGPITLAPRDRRELRIRSIVILCLGLGIMCYYQVLGSVLSLMAIFFLFVSFAASPVDRAEASQTASQPPWTAAEKKEMIVTVVILLGLFTLWTLFYGVTHGWFPRHSN